MGPAPLALPAIHRRDALGSGQTVKCPLRISVSISDEIRHPPTNVAPQQSINPVCLPFVRYAFAEKLEGTDEVKKELEIMADTNARAKADLKHAIHPAVASPRYERLNIDKIIKLTSW